eukprot:6064111-Amphidinium_carterae.1
MRDDDPSGLRAEGESHQDSHSDLRAEGGIPGQKQNEIEVADPSGSRAEGETVRPPPGLEYVRPTAKAIAKQAEYKPSRRLVGKQSPPMLAQLEEVHATNELQLRNNEDEQEKN